MNFKGNLKEKGITELVDIKVPLDGGMGESRNEESNGRSGFIVNACLHVSLWLFPYYLEAWPPSLSVWLFI